MTQKIIQQLRQQLREREALVAISNTVVKSLDLSEILQIVVDTATQSLSGINWAVIHLLDSDNAKLVAVAKSGLMNMPSQIEMSTADGIAGQVLASGQVVTVEDFQAEKLGNLCSGEDAPASLLVSPVEGRRRRIGTLTFHCKDPGLLTDHHRRMAQMLGVQAGMVIENAILYREQREARHVAEQRGRRLAALAAKLINAQEEERQRIARELHDETGQAMTTLKISLSMVNQSLPDSASEQREKLTAAISLVDQTMENVRRLSHNLRPPGIDAFGLNASLDGLCRDYRAHTDLKIIYEGTDVPRLADIKTLSLYRLAQEGLTNSAKHAEATEVKVSLTCREETLQLTIEDDGKGFHVDDVLASPFGGSGLAGMRERMELVDGELEVISAPGNGTRLIARVPTTDRISIR